jgi:hypothetical protein
MRIRFTRDYRGTNTRELLYRAGAVDDLPMGMAIVDEGAAVSVGDDVPITGPTPDHRLPEPQQGTMPGISTLDGLYKYMADRFGLGR